MDSGENVYKPETFEELNAMYRPKDYQQDEEDEPQQQQKHNNMTQPTTEPETYSYRSPYQTPLNTTTSNNSATTPTSTNNTKPQTDWVQTSSMGLASMPKYQQEKAVTFVPEASSLSSTSKPVLDKYSPPKVEVTNYSSPKVQESKYSPPKIEEKKTDFQSHDMVEDIKQTGKTREVTHDMDYRPEDEDIEYDEDDIYDDEEGQDEDSEELDDDDLLDDDVDDEELDDEEQEISDIDDTELMNRLEAKYGKLPAKEYESDEDPDDPTWTRNY